MKINLQDEITRAENHELGNYSEEWANLKYWLGQLTNAVGNDLDNICEAKAEQLSALRFSLLRLEAHVNEIASDSYYKDMLKLKF